MGCVCVPDDAYYYHSFVSRHQIIVNSIHSQYSIILFYLVLISRVRTINEIVTLSARRHISMIVSVSDGDGRRHII